MEKKTTIQLIGGGTASGPKFQTRLVWIVCPRTDGRTDGSIDRSIDGPHAASTAANVNVSDRVGVR